VTEGSNKFKDKSYKFLWEYLHKKLKQLQLGYFALYIFGGYLILSEMIGFAHQLTWLTPETIGLCIVIAGIILQIGVKEADLKIKKLINQFEQEEYENGFSSQL